MTATFTTLEMIKAALKEDMPNGDITTESLAVRPQHSEAIVHGA